MGTGGLSYFQMCSQGGFKLGFMTQETSKLSELVGREVLAKNYALGSMSKGCKSEVALKWHYSAKSCRCPLKNVICGRTKLQALVQS